MERVRVVGEKEREFVYSGVTLTGKFGTLRESVFKFQ